jgi:hypothetical protein
VPVPVTTPADDVVAPTEGIASGTQHHGMIRSTAQSVPKKKKKIQKGCRIFCLHSKLITFLQEDAQHACLPQDDPDGAIYYGTVTGGDTRRGYLVSMDILPDSKKIVLIKRGNIHVLDKDANEPKIDPKRLAAIEAALYESTDKRKSAETRSEEAFAMTPSRMWLPIIANTMKRNLHLRGKFLEMTNTSNTTKSTTD